MNLDSRSPFHAGRVLGSVLVAWIAVVIVRNAWLSDDAFITFRSVDNFVMGRGMTWNPGQRVQAFTHPLWFFIVSAAYAVTHEIYYTALALSVAISTGGLVLAVRRLPASDWSLLPALVGLSFSRAFVDYSTSGLENPLSHALLILWFLCLVTPHAVMRTPWFDLITGWLLLNRTDLGLLLAPTWLWVIWQRHSTGVAPRRLLAQLAWTIGPLLSWFAFSIFYFGFALPNTAYAKLGVQTGAGERMLQGGLYLLTLVATDPASAVMLLLGVFSAARSGSWWRALALGMVLYLLYIGFIGGDFMAGRFCSVLIVAAAATIMRMRIERSAALALAAVLSVAGLAGPTPPLFSGVAAEGRSDAKVQVSHYRITDERRYYYSATGLLTADRTRDMPSGRYRTEGLKLHGRRGVVVKQIGMRAFAAGPNAAFIDPFALTDPFLARIPADYRGPNAAWVAGHWKRTLPEGYGETVASGRNQLADPKLARLYDDVQLITTGPLWSVRRLRAIWQLNTRRSPVFTPASPSQQARR